MNVLCTCFWDEVAASVGDLSILVRTVRGNADAYEIIAGERRWRAAQRAGLHDVPIVLLEASDREALELAIVENVQRADLNAIEEASGYIDLIEREEEALGVFGHRRIEIEAQEST